MDKTARIWDARAGGALCWGHEGAVISARFSPDSQRIVTWSWTGWRGSGCRERQGLFTLREGRWVLSADSAPTASGSSPLPLTKTARIWDAASGGTLHIEGT
jgi:WD40 repeat protein